MPAQAQTWSRATDGYFTVETASSADARHLFEVFDILQTARQELRANPQLQLPEQITIRIYPTFEAFTQATSAPWYIASLADRTTQSIATQRLRVLRERNGLQKTLRHELAHLGQPDDWPRWLAEGSAMIFAGETVEAKPLDNVTETELNKLLATAPSKEVLARAVATAYSWSLDYWDHKDR